MRIRVDKLGFKSAGKAIASTLPLVGMFAGSNRNVLKGQVELVDQATGRSLRTFKVECDDDTDFSGSDAALAYGKVGLSFLPFFMLISAAADVADGAANKRDRAEQMLTRGFVMLSYKKAYGDTAYKAYSAQRRRHSHSPRQRPRPRHHPARRRLQPLRPQAKRVELSSAIPTS